MSKKTVRIISTLLTIMLMLIMVATPVFAAKTIGGVSIDPKTDHDGAADMRTAGNKILGIIQTVGTIIAVGVLMVLGIKYMMGSAEEKASYKKTMIPYIVGAILIFAATNIAKMVYNFTSGI